jgi:multicomponent Na+:H+ antiporter subunit D
MSPLGNLVVLPLLVPMVTAVLCLFAWRATSVQKALCVGGSVVHLIVGIVLMRGVLEHGVLATSAGDWPVPFGIVFAMDILSAVMVLLTGIMATCVSIYATADIDAGRLTHGFCPLFQTLIMGVSGAFTTGDLFNLYVQFEVMLTSSFVLLAIGSNRRQLIGGIKYVTMNLVASAIFLAAVGLLYGLSGTLNMADLSETLGENSSPGLVTMIGTMLIVAFGMKAAAFPMFFWLPASYHAPPPAISAIFSGLLTKVGLYSLIRAFTLMFTVDLSWTHGLMLTMAAITMVVGVLGAVAQGELRRLLSFQIVSHIGYILMGLGLMVGLAGDDTAATRQAVALALTGAIFYTMHHIVTATNLFLIAGVIERVGGTGRMARLGGMSATRPLLAVVFLVSALSLSGVPPLSGFWAKAALVKAGLDLGQGLVVAAALLTGALTLYSMMTAWAEIFWKRPPTVAEGGLPEDERPYPMHPRERLLRFGPILALTVVILSIGLQPGPFFRVAERAAGQLLDSSEYIEAVRSIRTPRPEWDEVKERLRERGIDPDGTSRTPAEAVTDGPAAESGPDEASESIPLEEVGS